MVNGQSVCVTSTCPNGSRPVDIDNVPTCVDTMDKSTTVYGYLLTNPCNRITSPFETRATATSDDEESLTYFTKRCPISKGPPPIPDELLNPYSIEQPQPATISVPAPVPVPLPKQDTLETSDSRKRFWISAIAIAILILLWLAVIYMWIVT